MKGVNEMSMPSFTAEASLYQTSERYLLVAGWNDGTTGHTVTPQQEQCPWWLLQTKTACPLGGIFGLWCRDFCGPPEANRPMSDWYFCGICFSFNW